MEWLFQAAGFVAGFFVVDAFRWVVDKATTYFAPSSTAKE